MTAKKLVVCESRRAGELVYTISYVDDGKP